MRERDAERRAREAEAERAQRIHEEEQRRREEEATASREELLAAIQAWGAARSVEDFFAEVEERAVQLPEEQQAAVLDRVARGRALLADVDPGHVAGIVVVAGTRGSA